MKVIARRTTSLFFASIFLLTSLTVAVVCREKAVRGHELSAVRAIDILPPDTSDPTKAVIYIENTPKGLYFHSNFVTPGYDFTNPTKIADEDLTDVSEAFLNIRFAETPSSSDKNLALQIYHNNVQLFLDTSVFSEGGYPLLDVRGAKNVSVVDGNAGKILTSGSVEVLDRTSPPPILMSKVLGCCLYGIPPPPCSGLPEAS